MFRSDFKWKVLSCKWTSVNSPNSPSNYCDIFEISPSSMPGEPVIVNIYDMVRIIADKII